MSSAPPASDRVVVRLFGRDGCHLCDEARDALLRMSRGGAGFVLREVDIERDPELHRRLLEKIPVIEVDGEVVCELVIDEDAVRARLDTLSE